MTDEQTFYITPNGEEFPLDVHNYFGAGGRYLEEINGLGMPSVRHVTRAGIGQHGETHLATRLQRRPINLRVAEVYAGRQAMYDGHLNWFRTLAPGDAAGTLRKVFPDGRSFDLEVYFQTGADAGSQDRALGGWVQRYALQLVAFDPIWKRPDLFTLGVSAYDGDQLVYPYKYPYWYDGKSILGAFEIDYAGSWRSYPTITLTGPMTNPLVEHAELGVELQLLDTITAGYAATFALDPYEPAVTHSAGANLIGRLSDATDLSGFYLIPGTNTIKVRAEGTSGASSASINYYERYLGV
jgi:hypothetical protein